MNTNENETNLTESLQRAAERLVAAELTERDVEASREALCRAEDAVVHLSPQEGLDRDELDAVRQHLKRAHACLRALRDSAESNRRQARRDFGKLTEQVRS